MIRKVAGPWHRNAGAKPNLRARDRPNRWGPALPGMPLVNQGGERRIVVAPCGMLAPPGFAPARRIDLRKNAIAFRTGMDAGNFEPRGTVDGLAIKIFSANDHDFGGAAPQGIAVRNRERGVEARSSDHARRRESGIAGDHYVGPARKRLADRVIGLASHHSRAAEG